MENPNAFAAARVRIRPRGRKNAVFDDLQRWPETNRDRSAQKGAAVETNRLPFVRARRGIETKDRACIDRLGVGRESD